MKFLILTGSPDCYSVRRIRKEAENRKHEITIHHPADLMCLISQIDRGHDKAYLKSNREQNVSRVLAKDFDCVIPRFAGASVFEFGCALLEHLNGNMRIPSTQWSFGLRFASNKFSSCQAFSQSRVLTPKAVFAQKPQDFGWIVQELGLPLVCKTLSGSQGQGVFLLSDKLAVSTTLGAFSKLKINLLLQKFIDSGAPASDIRVYVVDSKVSASYRRFALDQDFRSNYSISKLGEPVKLTKDQEALAIRAAKSVGLEGVCAVDLIEDKADGKTYCIEANGNGNLYGIEKVTGHNIASDIVDYAEKIARKSKKESNQESKEQASNFMNIPAQRVKVAQRFPNIYSVVSK